MIMPDMISCEPLPTFLPGVIRASGYFYFDQSNK